MAECTLIEDIMNIAREYKKEKRYLLAILQDIQKKYNYLPKEALVITAQCLKVPLSKVYSVATFYKALSLTPKGENIIKVCDGTACHIKGAQTLIDEVVNVLHIHPGETSQDGKFSLETVGCVGACGLAPVVIINEKYYGNQTAASMREILHQCRGGMKDGK